MVWSWPLMWMALDADGGWTWMVVECRWLPVECGWWLVVEHVWWLDADE